MATTQVVFIGLTVIASLVYVYLRTNHLRKREKELEDIIEARTAEIKKQKEGAEKQREIAKRSEAYKEQFLANMSHEIRTPMNAISGITNILKRKDHPKEQDQYLDAISQSADNLLVILNDILDLSKIEAGRIKIDSVQLNPRLVIDNVIDILGFKAAHNGLELSAQIDPDVPERVMGDPTRLNQILVNLAGNGIKFTEKGGIYIRVQKNVKAEGDEKLLFSVRDTGIGIVDDKQESIFGEYEQIDDEHGKQYAGTGLGLSVTKQLVELQDGQIWVESKTGEGSTFYFELPLKPIIGELEPDPYITDEELKQICDEMDGIKILLAEDNEFNIMVATDDIRHFIPNVQIDTAKNGDLAFQAFQQNKYDLVLMDILMPASNGYETTRKIRVWEEAQGRKKSTPIIAMTASLLREEIVLCFQAGMNNFVPKPYKIEDLFGSIYTEAKKSGFC